jgi:hypothetical protein
MNLWSELITQFKQEVKDEILNELKADFTQLKESRGVSKLYYSIKEVSELTGLTFNAVKGRQRRGTLKVVYEGQTPLIPSDEVNKLVARLDRQRGFK